MVTPILQRTCLQMGGVSWEIQFRGRDLGFQKEELPLMGYREKMTETDIVMQLLDDVFGDCFDTALIISADSDLATPMKQVCDRLPAKNFIAQPSGRNSVHLKSATNAGFTVGYTIVRQVQFQAEVASSNGYWLTALHIDGRKTS